MGRAQLKRLEKIERRLEQFEKAMSRFSQDCICFPDNEQPEFDFANDRDVAFDVKCPLHGDRFKMELHLYVPKWRREKLRFVIRPEKSARFQKAWAVTFPPHLWPAEEEETEDGTYWVLKDGTRQLAYWHSWREKPPMVPVT